MCIRRRSGIQKCVNATLVRGTLKLPRAGGGLPPRLSGNLVDLVPPQRARAQSREGPFYFVLVGLSEAVGVLRHHPNLPLLSASSFPLSQGARRRPAVSCGLRRIGNHSRQQNEKK